jgi:formylglycine-generating enzyme required for sulfatase activity
MWHSSCELIQKGDDDDVVLFPTTVIGPEDGTKDVSLTPAIVIGEFNSSVNAVVASYITVGEDYQSGPGFTDFLVLTKDTSDKAIYQKISNPTDYPYPPEMPVSADIVKKSKAYYILTDLDPATKYFWKIVHNAGDFELDVTPFRSFTTVGQADLSADIDVVKVEGGTFCLGSVSCLISPSTNVEVELSEYFIGKLEITNSQFARFLNQTGSDPISANYYYDIFSSFKSIEYNFNKGRFEVISGKENCPANTVSWDGALAFSNYIGGRLPTMAEWEFAAKGGNLTHNYLYSGDNDPDKVAWTYNNSGTPKEVGKKQPNELGIYDMTGNVREWCSDWFAPFKELYPVGKYVNPKGPATGQMKVLKGGSAYDLPHFNNNTQSLFPGSGMGQVFWKDTGFRIAKD